MVSQPCAHLPILPGHQANLSGAIGDVEEERTELRLRDLAPVSIRMKMEPPRGHTIRELKVVAPQSQQTGTGMGWAFRRRLPA